MGVGVGVFVIEWVWYDNTVGVIVGVTLGVIESDKFDIWLYADAKVTSGVIIDETLDVALDDALDNALDVALDDALDDALKE